MRPLTFICVSFNTDHTVTISIERGKTHPFRHYNRPYDNHTGHRLFQLQRAMTRRRWQIVASPIGWAGIP
jgi:hypothetical protein